MLRRSTLLLVLTLVTAAAAQRPFVVPNYYVSQLPLLVSGVPAFGELTPEDGQNYKDGSRVDLYQFEGEAGSTATLTLSSYDFDTYLSVFDPDGFRLEYNDDGDALSSDAYESRLDLYLDYSGKYTVVVSGYADYDLGAYTLELVMQGAASFAGTESLTVPGSVTGMLSSDDGAVPGGWTGPGKGYDFTVTEKTVMRIDAASNDFDTYLYLFTSDGYLMNSNDDADYSEASGYATDSMMFIALDPGSYFVYVSTWNGDDVGAFTLSFEEYAPKR
ncbi:MAG TPA: DVUA0089 family protein [Trueperaceae bacterium]|nr:DVUA0089 family protein [Trueperaceae bacterium]